MINQVTFAECKSLWDRALSANSLHAPFLSWEWANAWYHVLAGNWKEQTLLVDNSVIAPLARQDNTVIFSGGDEVADYLDIIGPDEKKAEAWEQILTHCKSVGVTDLKLRNIPENSSTIEYFKTLGAVEQEDTTPVFSLPDSWDTYLESLSKKYRHELERKMRKFDREHPDSQIIRSTNPREDMAILFQLMEKDEDKKAFLTPQMKIFFTTIAKTFEKTIALDYIAIGDKNIAATLSFQSEGTYYLYNSGFDKDCCSIAGFYLKTMTIKHAIESGIKHYNFLQGNERYKYELGGIDFPVYKISINL